MRASVGDPRPAIAERYRDFDDYLDQYKAAAQELATQGYLLTEHLPDLEHLALAQRPLFDGK